MQPVSSMGFQGSQAIDQTHDFGHDVVSERVYDPF